MGSVWKLYIGDYSKDGYEDGLESAKDGMAKNKYKFFKVLHPVNYVWNFNTAYNSYMKNYDKGYLDGQRVKNEIYTTTKTKELKMTNQNFEYHLYLLDGLKRNLDVLQGYLDDLTQKYKRQLDVMDSAGFATNFTEPLQNKYSQFDQKIDEIKELILKHKALIEKHENILQTIIQQARSV